jgi:outer membrane protein assembly factor BamB
MTKLILAILCLAYSTIHVFSQADFELRGSNRDGVIKGEKLLQKWPDYGPELFKSLTNLGLGYTLPAVTNDRIYITGMTDSTGYLYSFNIDGNLLWKKAYGREWTNNFPGTRSTPTIAGDKIYFADSFGKFYCYNKSGDVEWIVDMVAEFGYQEIKYGGNESPLIDGDKIYCTPGGPEIMIAVLNRHTGKTINTIKGNGQKSGHCSPVIVNHNNKKILLTMTAKALVGVDVENMEMLFQSEFYNEWEGNPNIPMYKDGHILISTQGTGSKLLKLSDDAKSVEEVWFNPLYDCENEGAIILDGLVYMGTNDKKSWYCFDWETGEMKYTDKKMLGKANVVLADGLLYTYSFRGYVTLVKPNPEKLEILGRFKMEQGSNHHICHPVIKNGKLYVRHGDVMNIYDIAG